MADSAETPDEKELQYGEVEMEKAYPTQPYPQSMHRWHDTWGS